MKKLAIEEMQKLAQQKGGKCLSKVYVNSKTKLIWQCGKGHVWEGEPSTIQQGHWCPHCAGKAKLTIQEMQVLARQKGGKCLSTEYVNNRTKLKFQCSEGHQWDATPGKIKYGRWCPKCGRIDGANALRSNIEEMQELARKKDGKCLSDVYVNCNTKLQWQCKEGHPFLMKPASVQQRQWCPHCAGVAKSTIEEMQKLAQQKGGKCLSTEYVNNRTKLQFQCSEGHQWDAIPNNIQQGNWCPDCAGNIKLTIQEIRILQKQKVGYVYLPTTCVLIQN